MKYNLIWSKELLICIILFFGLHFITTGTEYETLGHVLIYGGFPTIIFLSFKKSKKEK